MVSDERIVAKVQSGEKEAFAEIVERYEKPLFYFALRLCRKSDLAEDIVQDSFLRAYQNIWSFNTDRKFSSWMFRIVHNRTMDVLRKERKISEVDLEELPEIEDSKKPAEEIAKELDLKLINSELTKAIDGIKQKNKEVIILKYFYEKDYEEISDILKIPKSTVGTYLLRGKEELRKKLEKVITKEDL